MRAQAVDGGFVVGIEKTYEHFLRCFDKIDVQRYIDIIGRE